MITDKIVKFNADLRAAKTPKGRISVLTRFKKKELFLKVKSQLERIYAVAHCFSDELPRSVKLEFSKLDTGAFEVVEKTKLQWADFVQLTIDEDDYEESTLFVGQYRSDRIAHHILSLKQHKQIIKILNETA